MSPLHKPLVWLHGEVSTPPFSRRARLLTGHLLRRLQAGDVLSMPESRSMASVAPRCHELRVSDGSADWRLLYRVDEDAVLVLAVFPKKSQKTPPRVIRACRERLARYDAQSREM